MRQLLHIIVFLFFASFSSSSQTGIQWLKQFGGDGNDVIHKVVSVGDTAYLVFGNSTSADLFTNNGSSDVWVSFIDRRGKIKWQKGFGFFSIDEFADVVMNNDGTFVILSRTINVADYLLTKMSLQGDIIWQKQFGGNSNDIPKKLLAFNNTYFLIGNSTSTNLPGFRGSTDLYTVKIKDSANVPVTEWEKCWGWASSDDFADAAVDNSGNLLLFSSSSSDSADNIDAKGGTDLWLTKIKPDGSVLWSKTFGGNANDFASKIIVSNDGNYILGARTASPNNGDVTGLHYGGIGWADAWILKIDQAAGNIIWKNCYGGTRDEDVYGLIENSDGTLYVASLTSSADGDVTGNHQFALHDIWILKLSANGGLLWQKCLGGTKEETYIQTGESVLTKRKAIIADADGGCVIGGYTASVNGDVTGYHGTATSNIQDTWFVKLNANGTLAWQKCIGGTSKNYIGDFMQIGPDNYIACMYGNSNNGDFNGSFGGQDALIAKLGPINNINGSIYVDLNGNNIRDAQEPLYQQSIRIQFVKNNEVKSVITENGTFSFDADTGSYKVEVIAPYPYLSVKPVSVTSNFSTYLNKDSVTFALTPTQNVKDLFVKIIPLTPTRPGFPFDLLIIYGNIGTEVVTNEKLKFAIDKELTSITTDPVKSSQISDSLYWNLTQLNPYEGFRFIELSSRIASSAPIGDTIKLFASFNSVQNDFSPSNNYDTALLIVRGSFDPNEKEENHAGSMTTRQVQDSDDLDYIIRFQNLGNDTAFTVVIKDTLDANLQLNTIRMTHASHPYKMTIEKGNIVTWTFPNINLPHKNQNEPKSHGYVAFRILPKTTLQSGDRIKNSASIYFDFNAPVKTNEVITIIGSAAVPPKINITSSVNGTFCSGSTIKFTAHVDPSSGINPQYQWKVNGVPLGSSLAEYSTASLKNGDIVSCTYSITISNNIITSVSNEIIADVTTVPAPTITFTGSNIICPGGNTLLTASGNGSYQWYKDGVRINNANGTFYTASSNGIYMVTNSSAGCTSLPSNEVTITVQSLLSATITPSGTTAICEGATIVLQASVGSTYQWNKDGIVIAGATSSNYTVGSSGNYTVTISQSTCSNTSVATTVTIQPLPSKPVIRASGNVLSSSSVTNNQWYLNNTLIPGATGQQYLAQSPGNYSVRVTENNCSASSDIFNFSAVNSIDSNAWSSRIIIGPNPVKNNLKIKNPDLLNLKVRIVNMLGVIVYENTFVTSDRDINMQPFIPGKYLLLLIHEKSNDIYVKPILKQ